MSEKCDIRCSQRPIDICFIFCSCLYFIMSALPKRISYHRRGIMSFRQGATNEICLPSDLACFIAYTMQTPNNNQSSFTNTFIFVQSTQIHFHDKYGVMILSHSLRLMLHRPLLTFHFLCWNLDALMDVLLLVYTHVAFLHA